MKSIVDCYDSFGKKDIGDLTSNDKDELYNYLSATMPEDLHGLREHEMYVEILQKYRTVNEKDARHYGKNFIETIQSLLSVGEDGVYSNSRRFIYELIQNVDDCEYENVDDCKLDVKFEYPEGNGARGKIILTYNEKGFTPQNVFAITGIAEKMKNISADKVEIGEKGIGFKSVFGIADKVTIESGEFSFELNKENFTIPVPKYDNYVPVSGTVMTLEMSSGNAKTAFRSLINDYREQQSVLSQNPILFLNKLTHLKMYYDTWRYIEFDVQRKNPVKENNLLIEKDIVISTVIKDHTSEYDKDYSNEIVCTRYTRPIVYDKGVCQSRYGNDIQYDERRLNLVVVFPEISKEEQFCDGLLYSYLPTQVKVNAPIVMHVPFKLDGSREYVDPQKENEWFSYTINSLQSFLIDAFLNFALVKKQGIVDYIPKNNDYFFKKDNQKVACLCKQGLDGFTLCREKIFYTEDNTFESSENIVSFGPYTDVSKKKEVYKLLGYKKHLFIPQKDISMKLFNADIITQPYEELFEKGLENSSVFSEIVDIVCNSNIDFKRVINNAGKVVLDKSHLAVISRHKAIGNAFRSCFEDCIKNNEQLPFSINSKVDALDADQIDIIKDAMQGAGLNHAFNRYMYNINYFAVDDVRDDFFLAADNGVVLSKNSPLGSFGLFASEYDENKTFSASLQIRQASDKLNKADENMSNRDYMQLLREVRKSLKSAFGSKTYEKYISVINKAGKDENRFLNEILQNADDCAYGKGVRPEFSMKCNRDEITVLYNELGFTKSNVRSITAIGESTKKLLLSGDTSIGEKGVGFKSVFGVAEYVEIHSGGFDFKLSSKSPTIPEECDAIKTSGTLMKYKLKKNISHIFTKDRVLQLCLCLRNLKELDINGIKVSIKDTEKNRTISFDGKRYHFDRLIYGFQVTDQDALEERYSDRAGFNKNQQITCYIPKENRKNDYCVYVGLPTAIKCNVPIVIDAPFELTTSREGVLDNSWNKYIREEMYNAILSVMEERKQEERIGILDYIKFEDKNGVVMYPMFSDAFFNTCNWTDELRSRPFLPMRFRDCFIKADTGTCIMIPNAVAMLYEKEVTDTYFDKNIIEYKTQYIPLLQHIGVKESSPYEDICCVKRHLNDIIDDDEFREELIKYLYQTMQKPDNKTSSMYDLVKSLKIFPVKTIAGTEFVEFSENIYLSDDKQSDENFLVLDSRAFVGERKVRASEMIAMFTGENISTLTPEVYDARYSNNLCGFIRSNQSAETIANYLLKEYLRNKNSFLKCTNTLKGMLDEIPMKMDSGEYRTGIKFVNGTRYPIGGGFLSSLFVDLQYEELAKCLGCEEITDLHFDDLNLEFDSVTISDKEIEMIQEYFNHYPELFKGFIEYRCISDEQISKYDLQYCKSSAEEIDEDFPGRAVKDLNRLRKSVRNQIQNEPNPYIEKQRTIREPQYVVDKDAYTTAMYGCTTNQDYCFCQMCKKPVPKKYIERNNVQKKPQHGFKQMYLSLCLQCSKDYLLARNNKKVWVDFLNQIENADIANEDTIDIQISEYTITFTATHLAEIQEIIKELPNEAIFVKEEDS